MKFYSKRQLIARLKAEGLFFSEFSQIHEGDYAVDDADWNYKDVPHLHHVHQLVEAIFAGVGDDAIATINMQKVLGLTFPMSVFNYQSGPNEQTYYTTWFFFVLIVQTQYEQLAHNRTRVITTYSIGAPRWLTWMFPAIRWVLKRNYRDLMSTDIPMRERRGKLRTWGYSFNKDGHNRYGFLRTMDISRSNVRTPPVVVPLHVDLRKEAQKDGEYFFGRDDIAGIRVVREGAQISVFPRMCPHEGASLDEGACVDGRIKCPWHGRIFKPYAVFSLDDTAVQEARGSSAKLVLQGATLTVYHVPSAIQDE